MGTLGELKVRILNETKRPSLTAEVAKSITDAIEHYATKRWWFNEELDETITTVAGTANYDVPSRYRQLILAEITVGGQRLDLDAGLMDWEQYRYLTGSNAPTGQPSDIIFFGRQLYLYPTPADAYLVSLTYCSALAAMSDDTAVNSWTTEAEPLIRARAKWDLFHNVIRDYDEANEAEAEENRWFGLLQGRAMARGQPSYVTPSTW